MKIVFFTGAGISAESGISTFRDVNGLWDNHKIEEICNISTYKKNKAAVFKFYNERRNQLEVVEPNLVHLTMAKIQNELIQKGIQVDIITQNIDDLLERAGCKDVIHVHGDLKRMQCKHCDITWDVGYEPVDIDTKCPKCNTDRNVKPAVVFFGEEAPQYHFMKRSFRDLITKEDILIVIGTMGNVVSINTHAEFLNCTKILNNLEVSKYIDNRNFDYTFFEKGTEAILKIEDLVNNYAKIHLENKTK